MHNKTKFIEETVLKILHSNRNQKGIIVATLIIVGISILMFPTMLVKAKLLPKPTADYFTIYVDLPSGKSIEETKKVTQCIANTLKNEKEIENMSIFLGESLPVDFSAIIKWRVLKSNENTANILVNLSKKESREETSLLMVSRLRPMVQKACSTEGANIKFIEDPAGPPVLASLVAEITSPNYYKNNLNTLANEIYTIFKETKTLVDVDIERDQTYKKYEVILNDEKIFRAGLSIEHVKNVLYAAFEGMDIAYIDDPYANNQIPIHLVLSKETKKLSDNQKETLLNKLTELKLLNSQGMMVPLSELIEIKDATNTKKIVSKNLTPLISIIAEADMESQIYPLLDARKVIMEKLAGKYTIEKTKFLDLKLTHKKTGEEFYLHWDGEQKLTFETFRDLGFALLVSIIMIFLLMVIYYHSFSLATGIILASFISIAGVIYMHFIIDIFSPTTFFITGTSLIGFIGLIGINSRNSLLIIDFAKQLIEEKHFSVDKAIAVSIQTRAKPILLTVLAVVFASSLLVLDPVFSGLGAALIGGTLIAYLVSLFVVPVLIFKPLKKMYPSHADCYEKSHDDSSHP
ncbi:MAG: efflux RND transporter permease subunit [Sulfuricurvum sp.]